MVLPLIRFSWQALAESGLVHVAAQGCLPSALAVITGLCLTSEHLLSSQRGTERQKMMTDEINLKSLVVLFLFIQSDAFDCVEL